MRLRQLTIPFLPSSDIFSSRQTPTWQSQWSFRLSTLIGKVCSVNGKDKPACLVKYSSLTKSVWVNLIFIIELCHIEKWNRPWPSFVFFSLLKQVFLSHNKVELSFLRRVVTTRDSRAVVMKNVHRTLCVAEVELINFLFFSICRRVSSERLASLQDRWPLGWRFHDQQRWQHEERLQAMFGNTWMEEEVWCKRLVELIHKPQLFVGEFEKFP